jgi:hypothetical protein
VFQTAGVPPRRGSSIFAIIGCTEKSNAALTNKVIANSAVSDPSLETVLGMAVSLYPKDFFTQHLPHFGEPKRNLVLEAGDSLYRVGQILNDKIGESSTQLQSLVTSLTHRGSPLQ